MGAKVYFSIPVSLNWNTQVAPVLLKFDEYMKNANLDVQSVWWKRDSPYNISMSDMKGLVIMTTGNHFNTHLTLLPSGVASEVKKAISLKLPVYLAYTPSSINAGEVKFYKVNVDVLGGHISGLSGSSASIFQDFESFKIKSNNYSSQRVNKIEIDLEKAMEEYNPTRPWDFVLGIKDSSGSMIQEGDVIVTLHQPEDRRILLLKR